MTTWPALTLTLTLHSLTILLSHSLTPALTHSLTITCHLSQYLSTWPALCSAVQDPAGRLMGYIFGKAEGAGKLWHGHVTAGERVRE